ncbi:hypothetical protein B9Q11_03740 [Candidatus Marsarchaeota G2 archaeon ECH_B_SAG-F08]|uniref:Glycosyltransferase 2-like domain-containing protein n=6 Tax=Candidatus Marsarchaeota TaxID=1978152 RepID=A0A2R6A9T1_9ARCH|nr:MAG: hypothetical protein B9Q02_10920 [Candidatus Marsarchaeota G1 archaeon BE_D]PSN83565.1 MAG: hypothetical protein B9Q01_04220 [Candidatus Marsarchaeota G1 archaeon OSP_D]PSN89273.1 MAG: hypothetical protein B9Q00_01945 [Candidatus Marsarchaeota G1 archaeon OSP_C]PSN97633.1 MAG: hypothetical protein B9Q11_03740 [Candidatus Marsarchaeota G2 archaeon ECH_B_SAG-F08]PSO05853.1 MAG: hypothetical protein B9Q13_00605 [Candidatus Marsarchaeota G2 archaeon ECH_B_SAG-G16]
MEDSVECLVGICAYNEEKNIDYCLDSVLSDAKKILVVASGCTDKTVEKVKSRIANGKIALIEEKVRKGKASALNLILEYFEKSDFEWLALVNADSVAQQGAISKLVRFAKSNNLHVACGCPIPKKESGFLTYYITKFMWSLHNEFLKNSSKFNTHCTDELVCIKRGIIKKIPQDTVNDGALFSVLVTLKGGRVGFCEDARVFVSVPKNLLELIRQRSRILSGHLLIKRRIGVFPKTLETTFISQPMLSLTTFKRAVSKENPLVILLALLIEAISLCVATISILTKREVWIWRKIITS